NLTDKEEYHSVYRMRDCQGNDYSDLLELHIIELQKKLCKDSRLDEWIRLFNSENEEDLNMIKTRNIGIQRAKQILQEISLPETVREIIEDQRKRKMDRRAEDAYVFDQGKEQGIELGKEQGSEIGQERMARLTKLLLEDKRQKDLELALDDKDYREKLYREYRI
ncbi:MAG: PD-(D/E)XK nuclease family transposase, partial [Agathobacter sp.]